MALARPKFSTSALTVRWANRRGAVTMAILRAEESSAHAAKTTAIRLSHGPLKTEHLQRMAREFNKGRGLYSTAAPAPPMNPAIVNLQSGRFSRSWQTRVTWNGAGTSMTLWNTAPYAKFLLGTNKTIARLILQEVVRQERAARQNRLREAKSRALK